MYRITTSIKFFYLYIVMKTNQIILSLIISIILIIWLCYKKEHFYQSTTSSGINIDTVNEYTDYDEEIKYTVNPPVENVFKYNINEKKLHPLYNDKISTEIILYQFNEKTNIKITKTPEQRMAVPNTTIGFYLLFDINEDPKTYKNFLTLKTKSGKEITLTIEHDTNTKTQSIVVNTNKELLKISNLLFTNKDKINWIVLTTSHDIDNEKNNFFNININNEHKHFNKSLIDVVPMITKITFGDKFIGFIGKILALYTKKDNIPSQSLICDNYYCYSGYKCFFKLKNLSNSVRNSLGSDNANKCIMECNKTENLCNIKECQKICLECNDEGEGELWSQSEKINYCPWYKNIKLLNIDVPKAPKIRGFGGDGKITLEWRRPYDNNSPIINYVLEIKETISNNNSTLFTIIPNNNCDICEYIIDNLKTQLNYDIKLRAVNNRGIGYHSNLITVTTQGNNRELLSNIYNDINGDYEKYQEYECKLGYAKSDHILDNINNDDIDIHKYVKTID